MNGRRGRRWRGLASGAATGLLIAALALPAAGRAKAADGETERPLPAPEPVATPGSPTAAAGQAGRPSGRSVTGRIRGTVLDASRRPIAGLMVQLRARDQIGLLRVTGTDEKGQYLFQDLPQGVYDVEVGADGYRRERKDGIVVRPPFQNIVDFRIEAGPIGSPEADAATRAAADPAGAGRSGEGEPAILERVPVRGIFLDAQRRPVPEVSVTLIALSSDETYQAFSGTDGAFAIDSVRPGSYRVVVESPGYVGIDLKSVAVLRGNGLNLGLSLVEHPLNFKGAGERALPREEPLPLPAPPPAPESAPAASGDDPAG